MEIDLNSDVGEGFGPWQMGDDNALMKIISSANIACGYHAGDPVIMNATVQSAGALGVDIGAHVGFPDLMGFGRRKIEASPAELAQYVIYQLGALSGIAKAAGQTMTHMSFHGALGNMAAADISLASPLVRAVVDFDPTLIISVSTGTAIEQAADALGLRVATAFLADRAYDDAGQLVSRKLAGAVIHDPQIVMDRVMRVLQDRCVISISGKVLPMNVKSILLHGDTAGAVDLARSVRRAIEAGGGRVVPISRLCA